MWISGMKVREIDYMPSDYKYFICYALKWQFYNRIKNISLRGANWSDVWIEIGIFISILVFTTSYNSIITLRHALRLPMPSTMRYDVGGEVWAAMTKPLSGNSRVIAAWNIGKKSTLSPARMRLGKRIEWQSNPVYVIRKQAVNQYSLMIAVIACNLWMAASESAAKPSQPVSQSVS